MSGTTGRSIWAVVAGILFNIVVTTVVDLLLHVVNVLPPMGEALDNRTSLISLSYRILITVLSGMLTARLAPANPMRHAMALGYAGVVLGAVGVAVTWGKGMGPAWFPISLAVLAIPLCWVGGRLYLRRAASS